MRDNRFNGVGGGMNRRIGCILTFFGLCLSISNFRLHFFRFLDLLVREVNLYG